MQHFVYLAEESGIDIAERFLSCAETSFRELSDMPLMGATVETRRDTLSGMRKWRIREFEKFLIFMNNTAQVLAAERG